MLNTQNESNLETFEVFKEIEIGEITQDVIYLGTIRVPINEIHTKITEQFGTILRVDINKHEIIVCN